MSKKPIIGGIILAAIIGVVFVGAQINPDNPENKEQVVFHVTLADPALYDREGGLYSGYIKGLEEGWYEFRFVTSGDSPHRLSIELWQLDGRSAVVQNVFLDEYVKYSDVPIFRDYFDIQRTLVETEMSSWYTWDYSGEKRFHFDPNRYLTAEGSRNVTDANIEIFIDPSGTADGSVSVDLIKLD